MELGTLSLPRRLDLKATDTVFLQRTPAATSNYGVLNIGDGPFDGISTGKFSGSVNGTIIGANVASGYIGDFINVQINGVERLRVDSTSVRLNSISGDVTFWANGSAWFRNYNGTVAGIISLPTTFSLQAGNTGATSTNFLILQCAGINSTIITKGYVGQVADLQQWQNSSATVLARVDASGNGIQAPGLTTSIQMAAPTSPVVNALVSGGSLALSTTYYWVVTALDPFGGETVQTSQVTATTAGSGTNQTAPLVWTASPGAMGYNVYRSTTSGNFTNATRYTVVNATSFSDTGGAGTTATPPAATGAYTSKTSPVAASPSLITNTMTPSANYGLLNIGSGPFDGVSTGTFAGNAGGTIIATSLPVGYAGNFIDLQRNGASNFSVDRLGNVVTSNTATVSTGAITFTSSTGISWFGTTLTRNGGTGAITLLLQNVGGANYAVQSGASTSIPQIVKGATSQSADLQQWQDSSANILARIDASGNCIEGVGKFVGTLMASPTSPAVGAFTSGGSLALSTTYYWAITALDPFGGETISPAQITATTAGSGTLQTAPLSWTGSAGAMGYNVYRSTTSGNFTNATRYTVVNATTFNDTGAAGTTATLPGATTAYTSKISPVSGMPNFITNTATASANYGLLSIGSGPFDGASTGKFAGSASGTLIAGSVASNFVGDLVNLQVGGGSKFSVSAGGNVNIPNGAQLLATAITAVSFPLGLTIASNLATSQAFAIQSTGSGVGLNASSGVQSWLNIATVANQTGTAGYTALLVNSTETAIGSGARLLADFQLAGVSKFSVTVGGDVTIGNILNLPRVTATGGQLPFIRPGNTTTTTGVYQFSMDNYASPTAGLSNSSGIQSFVSISSATNQTGTAGYTALLVNSTEIATGSGTKLLQDWQVGGSSKASVDKAGDLILAGGVTTAYASKSSNYTVTTSDSVIVAAAASLVITLPSAAAVSAGRVYTVKNNNQTTTTVKTSTAGQTIDGTDYSSSGYALNTAFGVLRLVGDGVASWYTV